MTDTPQSSPPAAEMRVELAEERARVTPALESQVGISRDDLASYLLLDSVKGFGPQKFKELNQASLRPIDVIREPERLRVPGKRGQTFREALAKFGPEERDLADSRAVRQLVRAFDHKARIVTYEHPAYPKLVYDSNNPIPVLCVRGDLALLNHPQSVACVGSRDIAPPYTELHREFAEHAAFKDFAVVSGFALGADSIGHRAAFEARGATVVVMPCGLDRPFPPENKAFYGELANYDRAVIVSEFSFGTAASSLTLRKRNKLIVAFAQGVLVSQSSATGGAMNAYRFALEQSKTVATFAPDENERTSGNRVIKSGKKPKATPHQQQLDAPDALSSPATVFSNFGRDLEAWDSWLRQLSSST